MSAQRTLVPGERAAVGDTVALSIDVAVRPPLALALLALDAGRRPVADFPPIDTLRREMRGGAHFDEGGTLRLQLSALPASVERLALAAFLTHGGSGGGVGPSFRDLRQIEVTTDTLRFPIPLAERPDTALILVDLYRHAGAWRLAANGQGFIQGLPALAAAYGADRGWAEQLAGGPAPYHDRDRSGDREWSPAPDRSGGNASGSGVAVDARHVLTNAHVVEDARTVSIAGDGQTLDATVVFADPQNDLALLRVAEALPAAAQFRDGIALHLGEDVVALGFPLQGLLGSGPQASAGNIAALSGVGNDSSVFQFTAPIASGNSGGPIMDSEGLIIGLVCSSLNIDRIRAAGSNAENVNFGIKGATVRSFLDAAGLQPVVGGGGATLSRAAMVKAARASLYRVTCSC